MKYVLYGDWTDEAIKKLKIPAESFSLARLEELVKKGFFLTKKPIFPALSNQKITFVELPQTIYQAVFEKLTEYYSKSSAVAYEKTGFYWLFGYPLIVK